MVIRKGEEPEPHPPTTRQLKPKHPLEPELGPVVVGSEPGLPDEEECRGAEAECDAGVGCYDGRRRYAIISTTETSKASLGRSLPHYSKK